MKKIFSLLLAVLMLVSIIPTTMAYENGEICPDCGERICAVCGTCYCNDDYWDYDCDCNYYTNGTEVKYVGQGTAQYTITVPALLTPESSGTVTLNGTWASNCQVKVTADTSVELTNSINTNDKKTLTVGFAGIEKSGDNTAAVTATETVSVGAIDNALFGTWSGTFNYNVEYVNGFSKYDINSDGVVNDDDLDLLRIVYNQDATDTTDPELFARCDFDNNGIINSNDLTTLLANYTK